MPRLRAYENAAARQRAYRQRVARKRDVSVTDGRNLGEVMQRLSFIRDVAGAVSRDSIKNWRGWSGAHELHAHALQQDLDDLVSRLDALIRGEDGPFQSREFQEWVSRSWRTAAIEFSSSRALVSVTGTGFATLTPLSPPDRLVIVGTHFGNSAIITAKRQKKWHIDPS